MKLVPLAIIVVLVFASGTQAKIETVQGPTFNLTAKDGYISTPDGGSYYMYGYALNNDTMQYLPRLWGT